MKKNHTPGPWTVHWNQDSKGYPYVIHALASKEFNNRPLATVDCNGENAEFSDANVLLMCAAPEMLHALQLVEGYFRDLAKADAQFGGYLKTVRDAIAKAQGRT